MTWRRVPQAETAGAKALLQGPARLAPARREVGQRVFEGAEPMGGAGVRARWDQALANVTSVQGSEHCSYYSASKGPELLRDSFPQGLLARKP